MHNMHARVLFLLVTGCLSPGNTWRSLKKGTLVSRSFVRRRHLPFLFVLIDGLVSYVRPFSRPNLSRKSSPVKVRSTTWPSDLADGLRRGCGRGERKTLFHELSFLFRPLPIMPARSCWAFRRFLMRVLKAADSRLPSFLRVTEEFCRSGLTVPCLARLRLLSER